jgi:hypothetical protein
MEADDEKILPPFIYENTYFYARENMKRGIFPVQFIQPAGRRQAVVIGKSDSGQAQADGPSDQGFLADQTASGSFFGVAM